MLYLVIDNIPFVLTASSGFVSFTVLEYSFSETNPEVRKVTGTVTFSLVSLLPMFKSCGDKCISEDITFLLFFISFLKIVRVMPMFKSCGDNSISEDITFFLFFISFLKIVRVEPMFKSCGDNSISEDITFLLFFC